MARQTNWQRDSDMSKGGGSQLAATAVSYRRPFCVLRKSRNPRSEKVVHGRLDSATFQSETLVVVVSVALSMLAVPGQLRFNISGYDTNRLSGY